MQTIKYPLKKTLTGGGMGGSEYNFLNLLLTILTHRKKLININNFILKENTTILIYILLQC